MNKLEYLELKEVKGGAFKYGLASILGGVVAFLIGFIDGYQRPLSCNK